MTVTDPGFSGNPKPPVLFEHLGDRIGLVTLNRPFARNAIDRATAQALDAIVRETELDPNVWVVILTGAGDVFCAGADLKEIAAGHGPDLNTPRGGFAGYVYAERTKPWIAAVNGKALAGGTEIVLASDLVVAADTATFGLPEVSRGMLAAAGGLSRLPRILPRAIATELIVTGDQIDAARAHQYGMVNRLVPKEQVLDEAKRLAARIIRNAPIAVRESLKISRQALDLNEDDLRALTMECLNRVRQSQDYKEGPRAFIEKREPRWSGK